MRRALLIGSTGLVGKSLLPLLQKNFEVTEASRRSSPALNLQELPALETLDLSPFDLVVLTANLGGGVNYCEKHPNESNQFHFAATRALVDRVVALKRPCTFVFISTDYVFSDSETALDETAPPSPLNQYGRDKVMAERYILSHLSHSLVIRTTNVYGWDPETKTPNYFMGFYRRAMNGEKTRAPTNQFCTPTFAPDFAECIDRLILSNQTGVFHVVGDEFMSRYEWLRKITTLLNLSTDSIESILVPYEETTPAPPRPMKLKLSNQKVKSAVRYEFKGLESSMSLIQKQIRERQKG